MDNGGAGCVEYHPLPRSHQHKLNLCPKVGRQLPSFRVIVPTSTNALIAIGSSEVSEDLLEARKVVSNKQKLDDAGLERVKIH